VTETTVLPLEYTAHHEAAHTVVQYRLTGSADYVTIIPAVTTTARGEEIRSLGSSGDVGSDSMSADDMEGRIVSCYAGGYAQRRCDPRLADEGCDVDDEIAAEFLREWGWESREQEFRDRSCALVEQHWPEIVAVATELVHRQTLDETEVELVADAAAGIAEFLYGDLETDLAHYRALKRSERGAAP
jgi:hypothetical protein